MPDNKTVVEQTKTWLSNVIIKHSICPFAKSVCESNRIHYEVIKTTDLSAQLEQLILQCEAMNNDAEIETCLLIFPSAFADFEDYLDALDIATELMQKQDYEGVYQLASFHPEYCFSGSETDDASNYTNRSPYPMLHILREESIEKVLESFPNPENIPERNIKLTRDLGLKAMQKLLADSY